jgi:nucleolysin TIA-1/TIAR
MMINYSSFINDETSGIPQRHGFFAFRELADAEKALTAIRGKWLDDRYMFCRWPSHREPCLRSPQATTKDTTLKVSFDYDSQHSKGLQKYGIVVMQTSGGDTVCYIKNITPYTRKNELIMLFQIFGSVLSVSMMPDTSSAVVEMDTHENATVAICQLNGFDLKGRILECCVSDTLRIPIACPCVNSFSGHPRSHILRW